MHTTPIDGALRRTADEHARRLRNAIGARAVVLTVFGGENRHFFVGSDGLPSRLQGVWEVPEMEMLCQHLESTGGQLIVDDVRTGSDFADAPILTELEVGAFAGWQVSDSGGQAIGILAATADRPRPWSSADLTVLMEAAHRCRPLLLAVREAAGLAETARR